MSHIRDIIIAGLGQLGEILPVFIGFRYFSIEVWNTCRRLKFVTAKYFCSSSNIQYFDRKIGWRQGTQKVDTELSNDSQLK